jgi:K+-transporting ATPase ATPase A chain
VAWAVKPSAWLNNPSFHGFSEMLYEMTSSNANNGSGFEGLGDNNIFWNLSTGLRDDIGQVPANHWPCGYSRFTCQKEIHP